MSAVKREGTHEVICAAHKLLQESKEANKGSEGQISTFDFKIFFDFNMAY
jgi:hypothetical protein